MHTQCLLCYRMKRTLVDIKPTVNYEHEENIVLDYDNGKLN